MLCLVLDYRMRTRRLSRNVAREVRLPSRPPARERILSAAQVDALTERFGEHGDLVLAMGYLGLRCSELPALRVRTWTSSGNVCGSWSAPRRSVAGWTCRRRRAEPQPARSRSRPSCDLCSFRVLGASSSTTWCSRHLAGATSETETGAIARAGVRL